MRTQYNLVFKISTLLRHPHDINIPNEHRISVPSYKMLQYHLRLLKIILTCPLDKPSRGLKKHIAAACRNVDRLCELPRI